MANPKIIDKCSFDKLFLMGAGKEAMLFFFKCDEKELNDFCTATYSESYDELCYEVEYAKKPNQNPERPYTVYMHIAPNDKKYIGVTRTTLGKRWDRGRGYCYNEHFSYAIKKYGWDNIKHAILYMKLTREEAEQKEIELIKRFKTTDRRYGYNIEGGGNLRKEVSAETREKLRQRATGVIPSVATREKMSASHSGIKCHFYGIKVSDEHKKKLSEIRSKKVAQIDENGNIVKEYSSMKEAAKTFGITRQAISAVCHGKRKKIKGYYWKWI